MSIPNEAIEAADIIIASELRTFASLLRVRAGDSK